MLILVGGVLERVSVMRARECLIQRSRQHLLGERTMKVRFAAGVCVSAMGGKPVLAVMKALWT